MISIFLLWGGSPRHFIHLLLLQPPLSTSATLCSPAVKAFAHGLFHTVRLLCSGSWLSAIRVMKSASEWHHHQLRKPKKKLCSTRELVNSNAKMLFERRKTLCQNSLRTSCCRCRGGQSAGRYVSALRGSTGPNRVCYLFVTRTHTHNQHGSGLIDKQRQAPPSPQRSWKRPRHRLLSCLVHVIALVFRSISFCLFCWFF